MLRKKVFLISVIIFVWITLSNITFASSTVMSTVEYSDMYKAWLALPEEERANTIEPIMFSTKYVPGNKSILEKMKTIMLRTVSAYNLESSYNLKNDININIKNQQETNTCWAFSMASILETNIAKTTKDDIGIVEEVEFSTRHMEYATSKTFEGGEINPEANNREVGTGSNDLVALAYLTRGVGPILETDMPFENNSDKIPLSEIQNKTTAKKIDEYIFFPNIIGETDEQIKSDYRDMIKQHIFENGAVSVHIIIPDNTWTEEQAAEYLDKYYNQETGAMYYNGEIGDGVNGKPIHNHGVTIIGWDDNYSVDNFQPSNMPNNQGAFIVRNSWGTEWGEEGYGYISYDDPSIQIMSGAVKVSNVNYDNIYVHDELGFSMPFTGYLSVGLEAPTTANYAVNVFDKESNTKEELREVGLYFVEPTKYEIWVNSSNGNYENDDNFKLVKTGNYTNQGIGYVNVALDTQEAIVLEGDKFAIKVKYDNGMIPLESSHQTPSFWYNAVKVNQGESYVLLEAGDESKWVDLMNLPNGETTQPSNACIKAFTINGEPDPEPIITSPTYEIEDSGTIYKISNGTILQIFEDNVITIEDIKILDKDGAELENDNDVIATGMKLVLGNGAEYNLVVTGDADGDGDFTLNDLSKMVSHIMEETALEGVYLKAMDVNLDGETESKDMTMVVQSRVDNTKF